MVSQEGHAVSGFAWYAGRAAAMSPRELAWPTWRVSHSLARLVGSREQTDSRMLATSVPDWDALLQRFREGTARPVLLDQDRAGLIAAERPAEVTALIAQADLCRMPAELRGNRNYDGIGW